MCLDIYFDKWRSIKTRQAAIVDEIIRIAKALSGSNRVRSLFALGLVNVALRFRK
jgi:hypothetical protein